MQSLAALDHRGAHMSGVFSPTRAKIKERTLRTDKWWLEPAITFGVLFSFVIYATFRAFEGANY